MNPQIQERRKLLFHGFIAVAPLKHEKAAEYDRKGRLFHGFIAVAPLKRIHRLLNF